MQIFAFTTCPDFQALLEVECKELTGTRPVIQKSLDELKNIISILQTIDVLILDSPDDQSELSDFEEFLEVCKSKINNTLIYGKETKISDKTRFYSRTDIPVMFEHLKELVRPEESYQEWSVFPLSTLIHFQSLPFDLFLKLSDQRFVRRIPAYEVVDNVLIDSLQTKGFSELYCKRKHKRDFSMMLINNMINRMDRSYDNVNEQLGARDEVFKTTQKIIHSLGITGRVVEVCETAVEKMTFEVLGGEGELKAYLLALKNDKNLAFNFKLIHLTNYIGSQLIRDMNLPDMEEQVKKFVWASFFCDICIKNPAFHFHRKAEDSGALSLDEQNEVNFHALKASELLATYPALQKEVRVIITQHHGSFSGIGFPVVKSNHLLPLSKILIVAQDLAFAILNDEETPALEVLKAFLKKTNSVGLQDLLECLEESFKTTV